MANQPLELPIVVRPHPWMLIIYDPWGKWLRNAGLIEVMKSILDIVDMDTGTEGVLTDVLGAILNQDLPINVPLLPLVISIAYALKGRIGFGKRVSSNNPKSGATATTAQVHAE